MSIEQEPGVLNERAARSRDWLATPSPTTAEGAVVRFGYLPSTSSAGYILIPVIFWAWYSHSVGYRGYCHPFRDSDAVLLVPGESSLWGPKSRRHNALYPQR